MRPEPTRVLPLLRRALHLLGGCAVIGGPAAAQSASRPGPHVTDSAIVRDLGIQFRQLARDSAFSGTVLLARNGKILFQGSAGYADRAAGIANSEHTRFNLGSLGKVFTAVAVLQLADAHRLSLDDPIGALLSDYPNAVVASRVTVRQLLEHTSGLGDVFGQRYLATPGAYCGASSYLPLFAWDTLSGTVGTKWLYSNAGYIVLGLIVERVSGQSFGAYLRDHVFRPAGMSESGGYAALERLPNRATGYTTRHTFGPPTPGELPSSNQAMLPACGGPAGGGYSTASDLLRLEAALRRHTILSTQSTVLLMTGGVVEDANAPEAKYSLGLEELTVNGVRMVGHGGNFPGVSTAFDMYPELGYTVVVLSNADNGIQTVNFRLRWILRGQADELPTFVHLLPSQLRAFAGTYAVATDSQGDAREVEPPMRVTADTTGLLLDMGARRAKRRFLPVGGAAFVDRDLLPLRLTFAVDAAGVVTGLKLVGGGPPMSARRVP